MKTYGLLGRNISYSFSRKYFSEKFEREQIEATYLNFDLDNLETFGNLLKANPKLSGLNVTIPYKEEIIPYLDQIDPVAARIGAVNTIKIDKQGKLKGYNTDYFGFINSITPYLEESHTEALILGTGGASKAIAYGLEKLGLEFKFVSRNPNVQQLNYSDLTAAILRKNQVIINCTPLGTHPNVDTFPPIPTIYLTSQHLVFDLIYNPAETMLIKLAKEKNAKTLNGYQMLELQAEKSWEIWNHL